jgi:hypothetical protein
VSRATALARAAACVAALAAAMPARAADPPGSISGIEEPAFFPAGVADAPGAVGCVRTPDGGVEAIDLASGRRLWRSSAPARALLISRDRAFLLEQRDGHLRLAAYQPHTGRALGAWPAPSGLPAWASLAEPSGGRTWTTFDTFASLAGDTLAIEYDAHQHVVMGIPPGRGDVQAAAGVMRFDLRSGHAELRPGESLGRAAFVEPAPASAPALLRFHARAADAALMLGGPPPDVTGVLVAGDSRFGFERPSRGNGIVVRRWNPATGEESAPLEIGADIDAIWPTLDRRHVALRRAHDQWRFDVYTLGTGARVATLAGPVDIAVIGGRVLWTTHTDRQGLTLVATEPGSGRTLWRRLVWREPPRGEPVP